MMYSKLYIFMAGLTVQSHLTIYTFPDHLLNQSIFGYN